MWVTATLVAEPDTDSEQRVRRFALSPLLSCLDVPSSPSDRRRDGYCARLQPRVGVPYRDHAVNRERPAYSTASIHDASAPDRPASAARKVEKATPRRAGIREAQCRSLPVWPRRGLHAAGAYHRVLACPARLMLWQDHSADTQPSRHTARAARPSELLAGQQPLGSDLAEMERIGVPGLGKIAETRNEDGVITAPDEPARTRCPCCLLDQLLAGFRERRKCERARQER